MMLSIPKSLNQFVEETKASITLCKNFNCLNNFINGSVVEVILAFIYLR